jgi:RNA polymerase sigma-70 factor (ECF subfamily)
LRAIENGIDEQLLVEAAQRDPSRFAELYENNFERVYAYVARRVRDRDQAEDVTAEVFHQALANIGSFHWRGAPFVAWLFGIAANVLASHWRDAVQVEVATEGPEEIGAEDGVERRAMLIRLVESLPPDQREVLIRRFVDQRSIREIAQELGRSEGAVKQLQFRALQTLRARVRGSHDQSVVH